MIRKRLRHMESIPAMSFVLFGGAIGSVVGTLFNVIPFTAVLIVLVVWVATVIWFGRLAQFAPGWCVTVARYYLAGLWFVAPAVLGGAIIWTLCVHLDVKLAERWGLLIVIVVVLSWRMLSRGRCQRFYERAKDSIESVLRPRAIDEVLRRGK